MYSPRTILALLATTGFVAALPQKDASSLCWTSTICTCDYPTSAAIRTDLITNTVTKTHWDPSYITTSTASPVTETKLVTTSNEITSTWEVTTQVKVPYVTSRVVTIPVHTFSFSPVCETSTTELYPTTVLTRYPVHTTFVEHIITTSTPCETELYPVSTSLHTDIITRTVETCYTTTGHSMPTLGARWAD